MTETGTGEDQKILTEMIKRAKENFPSFISGILENQEVNLSPLGLTIREIREASGFGDDPKFQVRKTFLPKALLLGINSGLFVFHTTGERNTYGVIPVDEMSKEDKIILSALMDKTDRIFYVFEPLHKAKGSWSYLY